jgi:hypothetical protein
MPPLRASHGATGLMPMHDSPRTEPSHVDDLFPEAPVCGDGHYRIAGREVARQVSHRVELLVDDRDWAT